MAHHREHWWIRGHVRSFNIQIRGGLAERSQSCGLDLRAIVVVTSDLPLGRAWSWFLFRNGFRAALGWIGPQEIRCFPRMYKLGDYSPNQEAQAESLSGLHLRGKESVRLIAAKQMDSHTPGS
jgi:hypothetical protein